MPTLRTLFVAPTSSPLAQIDVSNVAELLVHLTSDKHIVSSNQTATQNENSVDDVRVGYFKKSPDLSLEINEWSILVNYCYNQSCCKLVYLEK